MSPIRTSADWPASAVTFTDRWQRVSVVGACDKCGHVVVVEVKRCLQLKHTTRWWARCPRLIAMGATCRGVVKGAIKLGDEEAMVAAYLVGGLPGATSVWKQIHARERRRARARERKMRP